MENQTNTNERTSKQVKKQHSFLYLFMNYYISKGQMYECMNE